MNKYFAFCNISGIWHFYITASETKTSEDAYDIRGVEIYPTNYGKTNHLLIRTHYDDQFLLKNEYAVINVIFNEI